jgi:hypothetical protein
MKRPDEQNARDAARDGSNLRLRDDALIEQFVLDYARHPELPDGGPSRWALLRGRAANLAARARTEPQPWETEWATAWRRRTAAEALVRIAELSSAVRQMVHPHPGLVGTLGLRQRRSTRR